MYVPPGKPYVLRSVLVVCGKLSFRPALVTMKRCLHEQAREHGFISHLSELKVSPGGWEEGGGGEEEEGGRRKEEEGERERGGRMGDRKKKKERRWEEEKKKEGEKKERKIGGWERNAGRHF